MFDFWREIQWLTKLYQYLTQSCLREELEFPLVSVILVLLLIPIILELFRILYNTQKKTKPENKSVLKSMPPISNQEATTKTTDTLKATITQKATDMQKTSSTSKTSDTLKTTITQKTTSTLKRADTQKTTDTLKTSSTSKTTDTLKTVSKSPAPVSSLDLLSAALSAAVYDEPRIKIQLNENGESVLNLHDLTRAVGRVNNGAITQAHKEESTHTTAAPTSANDDGFELCVRTFSERQLKLRVKPEMSVRHVKQMIEKKEIVPTKSQKLLVSGNELKDHLSLKQSNVMCSSVVSVTTCTNTEQAPVIQVDKNSLASSFDFDFTNLKDDGKKYKRGDEVYRRPYGWKRFALNVKGQFANDIWLGLDGIRTESCKGEWPVTFHGTSKDNAQSIAEVGFQLSKGKRSAFGKGIYTSPDIKVAEKFATEFEFESKKYLVVLQNRVNPTTLKKVVTGDSNENGAFWLSPNDVDVRPYGILIRENNDTRN